MAHSDDHASPFVPFVDIPVSIGHLFQGIASIYDRFYLSRFNKLFEEDQIFFTLGCAPGYYFLAA